MSGRRPDEPAGHEPLRPDVERLAEIERRLVELEARAAAYEAELIELRAYRQRNRDRSRRNALDRRQVKDTGTAIACAGTLPGSTGTPAGVAAANAARASRAPARSGFSGRVNNSAGVGVSRTRSAPPPPSPPAARPTDDDGRTVLDRLWADARIKTVIEQRGLNLAWECANFVRKPQGHDPRNWTVEYLEAWLLRSTVQVPGPTPITRAATDRAPRQDQRIAAAACASSAYAHDPWAGRRPPIAEADLVRGGAL